jgi:hypothetical protein
VQAALHRLWMATRSLEGKRPTGDRQVSKRRTLVFTDDLQAFLAGSVPVTHSWRVGGLSVVSVARCQVSRICDRKTLATI